MIVAIDGPAASGKGTLARRLGQALDLPHLDTGLLYRATARAVLESGDEIGNATAALRAARALTLKGFDAEALRGKDMGEAASIVAAMPAVRAALVDLQRRFADRPGGAVLDGRDIGTVICPHADAKIFVVASPGARARRRFLELEARGEFIEHADVLADILRRDERDAGRSAAPLKRADDAVLLDTTDLDVDGAYTAALAIVRQRTGGARADRIG